ncbi:MAG: Cyclic 2,3-diphosphoglycerate synthetase [candidate division WS2 bacterium]|uniref:Cyclic 2,3-diphosphoglycerate synthetase n=1 Tax=Psychracetigena formicireducens TaxID=2986056 RepID=A0A9E2F625_PSYF1|nr:Cyclic 2,3-diphosphoglycerate synthetase [Candidatus Psychracetigena formicireducens]MBT9144930.1 Cyclic 2,3-diphosphoglycerate synthetase [Candidatus Psychracetigena formicireducens]MBT9149959.1 Cyclic 2,3-diphosphoglycerate synthetase [Candidatus Psychracetigena formicireducens]
MDKIKTLIMGAAGRDFHNFNTYFRDKANYQVVAFTATQIPDIGGRLYPTSLAGNLYPQGIPIFDEKELSSLIKELGVQVVVFSYSDVPHEYVMHKASLALSCGADFWLLGTKNTQIESTKPVISICAVRTGSGKSQTTRRVVSILTEMGLKVVVIRHPMPYGDLEKQRVQRFETIADLQKHNCTIEEMEEYEPHLSTGAIVYAGVDYGDILKSAQEEADVVLWDGGNNDFPFYQSDLQIVVLDPLRPGHETTYHPGETNLRAADVLVINKIDTASLDDINEVRINARSINPQATIVEAASPVFVKDGNLIKGKKVVVVEDGPTLTHGEMDIGAGYVAALKYGALEIISPKPYALGTIKETFEKYSQTEEVLPAMGYSAQQIKELEETINSVPADLVIIATPIDLRRLININKPAVRVAYELQEIGEPTLKNIINERLPQIIYNQEVKKCI